MRISFIAILATIFLVPTISLRATKSSFKKSDRRKHASSRYKFYSKTHCIKPASEYAHAQRTYNECTDARDALTMENHNDITTFLYKDLMPSIAIIQSVFFVHEELFRAYSLTKTPHAQEIARHVTRNLVKLNSNLEHLNAIKVEIEQLRSRGGLIVSAGKSGGSNRPLDRELLDF